MLGNTDDLANPKDVNMWDFEKHQWFMYKTTCTTTSTNNCTTIDGRSRAVADLIGTDLVYIGGEHWGKRATGKVNVVSMLNVTDPNNDDVYENIAEFRDKTWAAAGVYHLNSFFIFGGGGSDTSDGAIRPNHASDRFMKYTLGDKYPCSKGSYRENGECVLCDRGTYKVGTGDHPCV